MADSHAFPKTHSVGIHEGVARPYGAIGSMASHLEVFRESFTAKQRMNWSMTSVHFMFYKDKMLQKMTIFCETHCCSCILQLRVYWIFIQ